MRQEMIIATAEALPNCILCGKQTHDTHVEYDCAGATLFMHLRCAARMSGTILRHINKWKETNANNSN